MRFPSVLLAALLTGVSSVLQAQEAVKSTRDVASGQATSLRLRAANSHSYQLKDIIVSSIVVISRDASGQPSRHPHAPVQTTITLPPTATPLEFQSGTHDVVEFVSKIEFEMLRLTYGGAVCSAKAQARFDRNAKRIIVELGDLAQFFDANGKPIAARCNDK